MHSHVLPTQLFCPISLSQRQDMHSCEYNSHSTSVRVSWERSTDTFWVSFCDYPSFILSSTPLQLSTSLQWSAPYLSPRAPTSLVCCTMCSRALSLSLFLSLLHRAQVCQKIWREYASPAIPSPQPLGMYHIYLCGCINVFFCFSILSLARCTSLSPLPGCAQDRNNGARG